MKNFSPSYSPHQGYKPPDLYEYFVDNFWFETTDLVDKKINVPLRGSHKADIVIIGGGYTGLSAAYNIHKQFPDKKIMILEGACCGYGASGRNGGFCTATAMLDESCKKDHDARQKCIKVSTHGISQIKEVMDKYGLDCDFEENGMLDVVFDEKQAKTLEAECRNLKEWGLTSSFIQGQVLQDEIKSSRCIAGLNTAHGATINPAKLARGMKKVVEGLDVEIREKSVVIRIIPGKTHHIHTELGEVKAPDIVLATNAYSHKIDFFKNRVFPMCTFAVATEPLTSSQMESIGWQNRQGISDRRMLFNYSILSKDNRIVIGGSDFLYYANDGLSSGNNMTVTNKIIKDLHKTFPSLRDIKIEHAWGGSTAGSIGYTPSIGVMGEHNNIYYGVGFSEGVPVTQTAGKIIADLMAGKQNEFTTHSFVNRNIPYAGPRFLRSMFGTLAKWYLVNIIRGGGH
ncbi:MAG: FAD-binding oxidoreductase [Desulfobacterales bacterium]|nr:FAD-binding oxidoreductase [Desulfobacterales bacterium]